MTQASSDSALFGAPWPAAAAAMMSTGGDCFDACASAGVAWQSEFAKFANRRIAENRRIWSALLSARDLESVLTLQQQWGLRAANDYTEEATRIARLITSLTLTGTTPQVQGTTMLLGSAASRRGASVPDLATGRSADVEGGAWFTLRCAVRWRECRPCASTVWALDVAQSWIARG